MMSEDEEGIIQNTTEGEPVIANANDETEEANDGPATTEEEDSSFKSCQDVDENSSNQNDNKEKDDNEIEKSINNDDTEFTENSKITVQTIAMDSSSTQNVEEDEEDENGHGPFDDDNEEEEAVNNDLISDEVIGDDDDENETAEDPMAVGNELDESNDVEKDNPLISVEVNQDSMFSIASDSNEAITGDTKKPDETEDEILGKVTLDSPAVNDKTEHEDLEMQTVDSDEDNVQVKSSESSRTLPKPKDPQITIHSKEEESDDDVIIEEGPVPKPSLQKEIITATSSKEATPPTLPKSKTCDSDISELILGLELECEDEPLEMDQLIKARVRN